MSDSYQIDDQYGTYYLTPTIVDWVDIFSRRQYRDVVTDSLGYCIKEKGLVLYGYVIMTNHLHLIVRSECGKLLDTIRDFKKFTASKLLQAINDLPESRREWMLHRFEWNATKHDRNSKYQVWTHSNHAELVYSDKFFRQKLNYIHHNPVRAGLVEFPEDYLYSSAGVLLKDKPGIVNVTPWRF